MVYWKNVTYVLSSCVDHDPKNAEFIETFTEHRKKSAVRLSFVPCLNYVQLPKFLNIGELT